MVACVSSRVGRPVVLVLALVALLSSGCAFRRCHSEELPIYWVDGTVTSWPITICEAR